MKKDYTPGQGCLCHAHSEEECGCGADWTPSEVYELRGKLERERALADRLGNALEKVPWTFVGREEQASEEWNAIAAWKEARFE